MGLLLTLSALFAAVLACLGGALLLGVEQTIPVPSQPEPQVSAAVQVQTESPFLDMLSYVPQTWLNHQESESPLNYVDFRANEAVTGIEFFAEYEATGNMWVAGLMRVPYQNQSFLRVQLEEGMRDLVGFSMSDIDRLLEFGDPPGFVTVYAGDIDNDAVGNALSERDFEMEERDGVPVWHRYDDFQLNLQERDPADPFGGDLGGSARVAIFDNTLVYTRAWEVLTPVLEARNNATSAMNDDAFRTLVEAIAAGEGTPIHVLLFGYQGTSGLVFPPVEYVERARNLPDSSTWGVLPPPILIGMSDHQQGENTVHNVALVYENAADAESAGDEIINRLQSFNPDLYEELGVTVDEPRIFTNDTGLQVVIASVRYPLRAEDLPPADSPRQPAMLFWRWMQMVYRREFFLFTSEMPAE